MGAYGCIPSHENAIVRFRGRAGEMLIGGSTQLVVDVANRYTFVGVCI